MSHLKVSKERILPDPYSNCNHSPIANYYGRYYYRNAKPIATTTDSTSGDTNKFCLFRLTIFADSFITSGICQLVLSHTSLSLTIFIQAVYTCKVAYWLTKPNYQNNWPFVHKVGNEPKMLNDFLDWWLISPIFSSCRSRRLFSKRTLGMVGRKCISFQNLNHASVLLY